MTSHISLPGRRVGRDVGILPSNQQCAVAVLQCQSTYGPKLQRCPSAKDDTRNSLSTPGHARKPIPARGYRPIRTVRRASYAGRLWRHVRGCACTTGISTGRECSRKAANTARRASKASQNEEWMLHLQNKKSQGECATIVKSDTWLMLVTVR